MSKPVMRIMDDKPESFDPQCRVLGSVVRLPTGDIGILADDWRHARDIFDAIKRKYVLYSPSRE